MTIIVFAFCTEKTCDVSQLLLTLTYWIGCSALFSVEMCSVFVLRRSKFNVKFGSILNLNYPISFQSSCQNKQSVRHTNQALNRYSVDKISTVVSGYNLTNLVFI